ncbi:MAG: adenosylhomocysteinase [Candidatus Omnitrophica bacterium]|nr:adenosylhomocysteinase [Candidatus Omnitrophota bacterium]MCM8803032.1 adenosylhomocysteinase [Candidatus Omnitrophota bacterium]
MQNKLPEYSIKDINLFKIGRYKVLWALQHMPVVNYLRNIYSKEKIFKGYRIGACLHITSETANLILNFKKAGAEVYLCASNPLSTQDEVAAYLVKQGISVFGKRNESSEEYYKNIENVAKTMPHFIIDDGGDLITFVHQNQKYIRNVIGATEETTTGVIRLKNLYNQKLLKFPIIAVNNAKTKYLFDNRYGTGQSTVDGLLRATNILIAGKTVVVCGYGWCGKGIAQRFKGMGGKVIVVEIDPIRALEAIMDGFSVMSINKASKIGDIFITATGNTSVITMKEIKKMKEGVILGNSGHFNVEIRMDEIEKNTLRKRIIRDGLTEYFLKTGKKIFILGEGRLLNLACAEGHPPEVMDMSFANQFLSIKFLKENPYMEINVHNVPEEIDKQVAKYKLNTMNVKIDSLTKIQKKYLSSWELGTL